MFALVIWCSTVIAAELPTATPGWVISHIPYGYDMLIERVDQAIAHSPLAKVTTASATVGARMLGKEIPGNVVIDVFAPKFPCACLRPALPPVSKHP
jgi:hypothetical protein